MSEPSSRQSMSYIPAITHFRGTRLWLGCLKAYSGGRIIVDTICVQGSHVSYVGAVPGDLYLKSLFKTRAGK